MHITFRQLRLFLALAETGSVSAAARSLHVTQPTASMQLKEIGLSVGLPLYELVGRKIYLTDAGRDLASTARAMLQTWDAFEQSVAATKGMSRGRLRIAVVSTAKYFMPRLMGSFCQLHPAVDVSLEILNRDGVVRRLRENLDDLYIMSQPPADIDICDAVLMSNPIEVIVAQTDPLASQAHVRLEELARRRLIIREKGSGTRMSVDQFFRKMRTRPHVRLELGSNEAIRESVAGGLGVGILSRHALYGQKEAGGVCVIPVEGFPLASSWHIVHPSGKHLSPLATAFKQHILQAMSTKPEADIPALK